MSQEKSWTELMVIRTLPKTTHLYPDVHSSKTPKLWRISPRWKLSWFWTASWWKVTLQTDFRTHQGAKITNYIVFIYDNSKSCSETQLFFPLSRGSTEFNPSIIRLLVYRKVLFFYNCLYSCLFKYFCLFLFIFLFFFYFL